MDLIITAKNMLLTNGPSVIKINMGLQFDDIKLITKCQETNMFFILTKKNILYALNGSYARASTNPSLVFKKPDIIEKYSYMVIMKNYKSNFINVKYVDKTKNLEYPVTGNDYHLIIEHKNTLYKCLLSIQFTEKNGALYQSNISEKYWGINIDKVYGATSCGSIIQQNDLIKYVFNNGSVVKCSEFDGQNIVDISCHQVYALVLTDLNKLYLCSRKMFNNDVDIFNILIDDIPQKITFVNMNNLLFDAIYILLVCGNTIYYTYMGNVSNSVHNRKKWNQITMKSPILNLHVSKQMLIIQTYDDFQGVIFRSETKYNKIPHNINALIYFYNDNKFINMWNPLQYKLHSPKNMNIIYCFLLCNNTYKKTNKLLKIPKYVLYGILFYLIQN